MQQLTAREKELLSCLLALIAETRHLPNTVRWPNPQRRKVERWVGRVTKKFLA